MRSGLWIIVLHHSTQRPSCASNPTPTVSVYSPPSFAGGRCVRCACEALQPRVSRQAHTDTLQLPFAHCQHLLTKWVLLQVQAAAGGVQRALSRPQQWRAAAGTGRPCRRQHTTCAPSPAAALHASNALTPIKPQTHFIRPLPCRSPVQQVECVRGAASWSSAEWPAMDHGAVAGQQVGASAVSAACITYGHAA